MSCTKGPLLGLTVLRACPPSFVRVSLHRLLMSAKLVDDRIVFVMSLEYQPTWALFALQSKVYLCLFA